MIEIDGHTTAKIEYDTTKPTMIPKRLIDNSKAREVLGFNPSVNIREGLSRTLEWYKNRK